MILPVQSVIFAGCSSEKSDFCLRANRNLGTVSDIYRNLDVIRIYVVDEVLGVVVFCCGG